MTVNSIMNFKVGHEVSNNGQFFVVRAINGLMILCEKNGEVYDFRANELTIVGWKKKLDTWRGDEIATVEQNIHLSNKQIGDLLGRTASSVAVFKTRNNLIQIA